MTSFDSTRVRLVDVLAEAKKGLIQLQGNQFTFTTYFQGFTALRYYAYNTIRFIEVVQN